MRVQLSGFIESEFIFENETEIETHRYPKEGSHWCAELDRWYDTEEVEQNNINDEITISLVDDNW